ncbi:MAG: hypothetical protein SFW08_07230 [Gemmatimonadaceae bacterium]|nr:hypothetical protein [Gemmatimonadaceae bacterium]
MSRGLLLCGLVLCSAFPLRAQLPSWEVAAVGIGQSARRGVALGNAVGAAESTPRGGEGWLRAPYVSLGVRYVESASAPAAAATVGPALGSLAIGELLVGFGDPTFVFEGGYVIRRVVADGTGRSLAYPRFGMRSVQSLGTSGGRAAFAGAVIPTVRDLSANSEIESIGYIVETQLEYRPRGWPVVAVFGYRHEWLRLIPPNGLVQIEETGRIVLGVGIAVGRE